LLMLFAVQPRKEGVLLHTVACLAAGVWLALTCVACADGRTATAPAIPTPGPDAVRAKVLYVVDGDTIHVEIDGNEYRLRYIGMDAPERDEEFYQESTDANRTLVQGETVRLEKDVSETDRYGRLLRYVWVGDVMVSAEMVRLGYAHAGTYVPDVKHQARLIELQREAMAAKRGLWGDGN